MIEYDHIFNFLDISTNPFAVCEISGTSELVLEQDEATTLHYVLSGEGEIEIPDLATFLVSKGDFVLIPALFSHSLRGLEGSQSVESNCKPAKLELLHLIDTNELSGGDIKMVSLCAHVHIGLRNAINIVDLIRTPQIAVISRKNALHPIMELLISELATPKLASSAIIKHSLTLTVIELLRQRLINKDPELNWMMALKDLSFWRALQAMLDNPGFAHSLESLASIAGLSRSAFAAKFSEAYGSGPMELLSELRIQKAAALLSDGSLPVKSIAYTVGFSSRTSFSRTFRLRTGLSPSEYRSHKPKLRWR